jgi:hypothetical protein
MYQKVVPVTLSLYACRLVLICINFFSVPPGTKETLLVASTDGVRQYRLNGSQSQSFTQDQAQAMDFNHRNNTVCWVCMP